MRRKVVISTAGSAGDLNPFIALAIVLKERGYEPLIASQDEFRGKVEAEGLRFHALRPGVEDVKVELGLDEKTIMRRATNGAAGLPFLVRRIAMPFLRRAYDDMMAATEGAALVITHPSAFAARLAADKRGLPWMSAVLAPFGLMSAHDPPVFSTAPGLATLRDLTSARFDSALLAMIKRFTEPWTAPYRSLRRELGLAPVNYPLFEGQFSPHATLAIYSRWLGDIQPDFPPACHITGFAFYDADRGRSELPPDLNRFLTDGPPPLVFTLGTAVVKDPGDFYRRSLKTAQSLGRRAVFLGARDMDSAGLGLGSRDSLPKSVFAAGYVPHSLIFPRAQAIVHHGGVGTTAQALRAGKPQLIVPFAGDQPDNAARVARMGVGRTLAPSAYTPARAAAALEALTNNPAPAARAAMIGRSVISEDGASVSADIVESLLEARTPRRAAAGR